MSAFPDCILGPLLDDVLNRSRYLPAGCVIEPDDAARARLVTELAEVAGARGARVIIVYLPSVGPHLSHAVLSKYAMPEQAGDREFAAVASDPGRERPVLLIAPQDLPAAILRDLGKYTSACVVVTAETRDGYSTGDMVPDEFSLLWHDGKLTAPANGIARLLDVPLSDVP